MIESTTSERLWTGWCAEVGVDDVYWSWPHLALWSREWGAEAVGVRWSDARATVLMPILRCSLAPIAGGEGRCDVRTAYDFAGPLWSGEGPYDVAAFERDWDRTLTQWGAVTEFQRLHPFRHPVLPSAAAHHADNFVVDLSAGYDAARGRYQGNFRRHLQKAERRNLEVAVSWTPSDGECAVFHRLYGATMERLGVPNFSRVSAEALASLFALDSVALVTVRAPDGEPASAACLLRSGSQLFYHLSGTDPAHRRLRATHLSLDAMVRTGCALGCDTLHLGGGSESLRHFKSRLSSGAIPYYVIKRVLDGDAHASICAANDLPVDSEAFPAWLEPWFEASRGAHA